MFATDLPVWQNDAVFKVGDVVRRLRKDRGWTQDELAKRAGGINKETINRIEGGSDVRLNTLLKVAEALQVVPERLFPQIAAFEHVDEDEQLHDDGLSPEAEALGRTFDKLRDVNSRRILLEMAERFRAAEPQQPGVADSSPKSASTTTATTDEELPRIRKTRGA
jgi:transcriptional regulator with XRE-family HTH domain